MVQPTSRERASYSRWKCQPPNFTEPLQSIIYGQTYTAVPDNSKTWGMKLDPTDPQGEVKFICVICKDTFENAEMARSLVDHWNTRHCVPKGTKFGCFVPSCSSKFTEAWNRQRHIIGHGPKCQGSAECRVAIAQFPDYRAIVGLTKAVYEECKERLLEDLKTLISKKVLTLAEIQRDFSQFYDILSDST